MKEQWKRANVSTNFEALKEALIGHTITDVRQTHYDNSLELTLDDGTVVEFEEHGDDMSCIQYYIGCRK